MKRKNMANQGEEISRKKEKVVNKGIIWHIMKIKNGRK